MKQVMQTPGELTHRLALQRPVESPGSSGSPETGYEFVGHAWAALADSGSARQERAGQMVDVARLSFVMRYRSDVSDGWRLVWKGRNLKILTTHDPDGTRRFLVCSCEEEGL